MPNHRIKMAEVRRLRMRRRLLEASLVVFGEKGVDASVIDEIIRLAKVSRGTFYNYFQSNEEVMRNVSLAVGNEVAQVVSDIVDTNDDVAYRVATGIRLWLVLIRKHLILARFYRRSGLYFFDHNDEEALPRSNTARYLTVGMQTERFSIPNLGVGFVVIAGLIVAAIAAIANGPVPDDFGDAVAERMLLALGVEPEEARSIAHGPLEQVDLPLDSLILKAEELASASSSTTVPN